jgi:hypothetical protein
VLEHGAREDGALTARQSGELVRAQGLGERLDLVAVFVFFGFFRFFFGGGR